nr:MAG TPA: hypothetical protein [Caudoviricetes sp.]
MFKLLKDATIFIAKDKTIKNQIYCFQMNLIRLRENQKYKLVSFKNILMILSC